MTFLKWLWYKWLPIARAIGNFQGQVILSVFYLLILFPVGVIMRFFSDIFKIPKGARTNFSEWDHKKQNLDEARKQY